MIRHYFLLFFLSLVVGPLAAQIGAVVSLDSNFAETGEAFVVHISVPKSLGGEPQQIDFTTWDSIFPTENRLAQTVWTNDGPQYIADLTLITFDADTLAVPPLAIRLQGGGHALTNPFELIVLATPSPDDLNDMAEIKDIYHEPVWWTDYWPWAVGGLVVLLLLGMLFWLAGRSKKSGQAISRSVELPPHELALRRLEVLTQKRLWQQDQVKEYYAELTYILREYLEKRFHIPALESTSEELLAHLARTDFPENFRLRLHDLLAQADLAKFAKSVPPVDYHHQAWQEVRQVVAGTALEPAPAA